MRSVEMKNGCLLYYGNPVGYQTERGMVADTMFRREELEGWLARKGLSVRWEDGVYDRLHWRIPGVGSWSGTEILPHLAARANGPHHHALY